VSLSAGVQGSARDGSGEAGASGVVETDQHIRGKRGEVEGLAQAGEGLGVDAGAQYVDVGVVVGPDRQVQRRFGLGSRQPGRRAAPG